MKLEEILKINEDCLFKREGINFETIKKVNDSLLINNTYWTPTIKDLLAEDWKIIDSTFQKQIDDLSNQEINIQKEFFYLVDILKSRINQVYDKIQEDPKSVKNADYVLNKHLEQLSKIYDKMNKIIGKVPEKSKDEKLLNELISILSNHCGEKGNNEGAVETLKRIINERDVLKIYFNHAQKTKNKSSWKEQVYKELLKQSSSKEFDLLEKILKMLNTIQK